jgi:hypothetical protein
MLFSMNQTVKKKPLEIFQETSIEPIKQNSIGIQLKKTKKQLVRTGHA